MINFSLICFFQLSNASQLPDRTDQGGVRLHHVGRRWERLPQEVHGSSQEHQAKRKGDYTPFSLIVLTLSGHNPFPVIRTVRITGVRISGTECTDC